MAEESTNSDNPRESEYPDESFTCNIEDVVGDLDDLVD